MGFLRRILAAALTALLSRVLGKARPLELQRVSAEGASAMVSQATRNGLKITLMSDYDGAPWAWTVEDEHDGKLVHFRGNAGPDYDVAVAGINEWLASDDGKACQAGKRLPFDGPPRAA